MVGGWVSEWMDRNREIGLLLPMFFYVTVTKGWRENLIICLLRIFPRGPAKTGIFLVNS